VGTIVQGHSYSKREEVWPMTGGGKEGRGKRKRRKKDSEKGRRDLVTNVRKRTEKRRAADQDRGLEREVRVEEGESPTTKDCRTYC